MVTLEEKLVSKGMNDSGKKRRERGEEGLPSVINALIRFSNTVHCFSHHRRICMSVNVVNVGESECNQCDGQSFHTD